ncbi:hypothetical protein B0H19DRAFT_1378989 [Mycena capillaripes]|nr:hypothetical protein B0H19DRAFT_1378989 [Mycena capillaripes]
MLASLEADRARAADLESQILDLELALSSLRIDHALVQERLDSYKYPVLTLPNEIISEIFVHFLPIYPSCSPLMGILSPNTLLCICQRWKAIALSTSTLWRAISFEYMLDPGIEAQCSMAEAWLRRSGLCPLSIDMIATTDRLLTVIVPHRARWEHVKLTITLSGLFPGDGDFPLLQQLEIRGNAATPPTLSFPDMPLLRAVTLWNFDYPPRFLPWAQLTSLTLIAKQPHECTPLLAHATNLLYCELILFDDERFSQPNVTLPYLESLVLFNLDEKDEMPVTGYLLCFIAPALCRLQVPERCLGHDPIATLTSFISNSQCKLREVHITGDAGYEISDDAYRTALPTIPKVSFNRLLIDWYCSTARKIRQRGMWSITDFET